LDIPSGVVVLFCLVRGEFHWGATSITHADSAQQLWRPGVSYDTLCGKRRRQVEAAGIQQESEEAIDVEEANGALLVEGSSAHEQAEAEQWQASAAQP
jgi:hypothetical protein